MSSPTGLEAGKEEGAGEDDEEEGEGGDGTQNRSEKKARKAIQKLGMKLMTGVARVTVKKSKSILFVITKPDVYKAPGSDTYIVFGEAKVEDTANSAQSAAADQFRNAPTPASRSAPKAAASKAAPKAAASAGGADSGAGLEEKDIELVVTQASVTRAAAIKALRENDGVSRAGRQAGTDSRSVWGV